MFGHVGPQALSARRERLWHGAATPGEESGFLPLRKQSCAI